MHLFCCFSSSSMKTRDPLASAGSTASAAEENGKKTGLARDLRINCVAGDGICGILYKWVNYWMGWKLRWFVLEDGVLSYYKFHGPDRIVVNKETVKGSRVIGDDSIKWIHRQQLNHNSSSSPQERPKAAGEIHLKVSSIQENRSDDRKFDIFTGMKWLHLRAESRESRTAWMEAFQAVKEVLPLIPSNELMSREWSLSTSTEKLKQRLLEEGLNEAAIREVEQIMKNEFGSLQKQLLLLNQRQWLIKEMLRQLEVHAKLSRKPLNSYRSVPCRHLSA